MEAPRHALTTRADGMVDQWGKLNALNQGGSEGIACQACNGRA